MEKPTPHEREVFRRYLIELGASMCLYVVVLTLSMNFGFRMHAGIVRTLLLVSPMAPFALAAVAIMRQIRRVDEYQRLLILETIAISALVTAGGTFTYGFLEIAGYPQITMFAVWPLMGATWLVTGVIRGIVKR